MSPQGELLSAHIDRNRPFVKKHLRNGSRDAQELLKLRRPATS